MSISIFLVLCWWKPLIANAPIIPNENDLIITSGNSLLAKNNPDFPLKTSTLGSLTGRTDVDYLKGLIQEKYPELDRIIQCESTWREKVCSYAGCEAVMGYAQIIPNTLLYCERKLGKKLDAFNGQDNLECALWLYINEGKQHWDSSKHCWDI